MQCDSERPCSNCVRRKVADLCVDIERKKGSGRRKRVRSVSMSQSESISSSDGKPSSAPSFSSKLAQQEFCEISKIITSYPPSPSDFFDFDFQQRPSLIFDVFGSMSINEGSEGCNLLQELEMPIKSDSAEQRFDKEFLSPLEIRAAVKTPNDIYLSRLIRAYEYPNAYHALIAYLKKRFSKQELLTIVKCISKYRPSFISATQSLYERDLLFAEQSFQRCLLEYESSMEKSSSPTVIWRRTAEIVALTDEFCILTAQHKRKLLSRRSFIIELMDEESTLKYFQVFSDMAFADGNSTIRTICNLRRGETGAFMKFACVWTIKRDIFDIPMLIVGQFLPVFE